MSCLGVHFALSDGEVKMLLSIADERDRLSYVQEVEDAYLSGESRYAAQSDKSWDALHRLLSDGLLTCDGGSYPLNHAVLAGELLYSNDDYIMSLKTSSQVKDIAATLLSIDQEEFRTRYYRIDSKDYDADLDDDDLEYTWSWFQGVRDLYALAAQENRCVLFTADQ